MTISIHNNVRYRVSKQIDGEFLQFYFHKSKRGFKEAEEKEKELTKLRIESMVFGAGKKTTKEHKNKQFSTGVPNIILCYDYKSVSFKVILVKKKGDGFKSVSRFRSVNKHGYKKAWLEVCKLVEQHAETNFSIPLPPCKKKAIRYLRSIGAPEHLLQFDDDNIKRKEINNKYFQTGFSNVSILYNGRAVFVGAVRIDGHESGCGRCMNKHGYEEAWNEVCDFVAKKLKLTDYIQAPPPPSRRRVKTFLRSIGVEERLLHF